MWNFSIVFMCFSLFVMYSMSIVLNGSVVIVCFQYMLGIL
jgi:hypothetical protein